MGNEENDLIAWLGDRAEKMRKSRKQPVFPFPNQRPAQKEFIEHARSILSGGGNLVAHAPTGIGKTAASLYAALDAGMENGKTVLFLTSRQSQHRIALETLQAMQRSTPLLVVDVVAKRSMCPRRDKPPGAGFIHFCAREVKGGRCRFFKKYSRSTYEEAFRRPLHVDELVLMASRDGMCPHRTAWDMMGHADVIVCDYNYLFSDMRENFLDRSSRPLTDIIAVVDEAHNLPDRVREEHSMSLTQFLADSAFKECRGEKRLQHYLMLLSSVFLDFERSKEGLLEKRVLLDIVEGVLAASITPLSYDEFSNELRKVGEKIVSRGEMSAALELSDFLDLWVKDYDSTVRFYKGGDFPSIVYRVLDPSHMSGPIFQSLHSSLLMSGTLYPMEMYRDLLGLESRRTIMKSYISPFPSDNRPLLVDNTVTTKYQSRGDNMYNKIASHLQMYMDKVPGNVAVFFQSYDMMENIGSRVYTGEKKRFVERAEMSKEEKDEMVNELLNARKRGGMAIFGVMGASLAEGIDYRDNALDMVAVVGLPLAPPNLETRLVMDFYVERFGREKGEYYGYIQPAMNRVLQAAGRPIRSKDDRAVVILMDERFLWNRYGRCFPEDMGLDSSPILDVLKNFYGDS